VKQGFLRVSGNLDCQKRERGNRHSTTTIRNDQICVPVMIGVSCAATLGRVRAKHVPFAPDGSWASLDCADLASGEEGDIVCAKDETEMKGNPK
jgi:hypothetical protein